MTASLPPNPRQFRDLQQWAQELYEFQLAQTRFADENNPLPVLLPHRSSSIMERATTGGVLLFDPITNRPVVSIDGEFIPILVENDVAISGFGEQIVANRTPLIELNSAYGVSDVRDITAVTGSGTVTDSSTGEIKISTGTTGSSTAQLETGERGRYIPGFSAEFGIGVRVPTAPDSNKVLTWGGSGTNSFNEVIQWGYDATGVYVSVIRNGSETKVYQSNWNIDTLDGNGASGLTLDMAAGNIFQVEFSWYGYGIIEFKVVMADDNGKQLAVPVHFIRVEDNTSIQNPNLFLFQKADNGGDTENIDLYVGGRSYTILGLYKPQRRITGQERSGVNTGTSAVPIVTFKRKSGFLDRSLRLFDFDVAVTSQPVIMEVYLNASLTGESYGTPTNATADETAVETDTSATAITGGVLIYSKMFQAGAGSNVLGGGPDAPLSNIEIPREQPVTLAARTLSGSGSIDAHFSIIEEW